MQIFCKNEKIWKKVCKMKISIWPLSCVRFVTYYMYNYNYLTLTFVMTKARTARYLWHDKGQIFISDRPFLMTKDRYLSDLCYVWHDKGQRFYPAFAICVTWQRPDHAIHISSLCHVLPLSYITIIIHNHLS